MSAAPDRLRFATRAALVAAARAAGYPEGYAPSALKYDRWAKGAPGRLTASQFRSRHQPALRWSELVRWAGLGPAASLGRITRKAVIEDLRRVAVLIGTPGVAPTPRLYRAHGRYAELTVRRALAFEGDTGWFRCCASAGLRTRRNKPSHCHTRASVIRDYRRAALAHGYAAGGEGPTAAEFESVAGYRADSVRAVFRSLGEIAEAAGYQRRIPQPPVRKPRAT